MAELPFDADKLPDPDFEPPTLSAAVEGWRVWRVSTELPKFGAAPKLYSATYHNYYWTPRKACVAECESCGDNIPGEHHSCGMYSAKSLEHLLNMRYHLYEMEAGVVCVLGQVANWGKVIEATQGWRSQISYPVRLWVPFECAKLAKPLKEAYGVPVGLRNWLGPYKAGEM